MAWLLRKCAALLVVYSIALQALIGGFLAASHFGVDPFAIICSADSSGGQKHSPPQHRSDCDACLPACGSPPALVPPSVEFSPLQFAEKSKHTPLLAEALSLPSRHQPQASRGASSAQVRIDGGQASTTSPFCCGPKVILSGRGRSTSAR